MPAGNEWWVLRNDCAPHRLRFASVQYQQGGSEPARLSQPSRRVKCPSGSLEGAGAHRAHGEPGGNSQQTQQEAVKVPLTAASLMTHQMLKSHASEGQREAEQRRTHKGTDLSWSFHHHWRTFYAPLSLSKLQFPPSSGRTTGFSQCIR